MSEPSRPRAEGLSYRDAGVDIERGEELVRRIAPGAKATARAGTMGDLGGFGGLFDLARTGYRDPILVSSTDGVGTKLMLAIKLDHHADIGIDLVAMCVNDVIVQGAEPLFFLDYFACGELRLETAQAVIDGIARGCRMAGASLLGGETAEMPGMYDPGHYDLAGFCVGVVERERLVDGRTVAPGDVLLGLASNGLHANGYSLVRRILERADPSLDMPCGDRTLAEALLAPTRIYVKPLLATMAEHPIKALAHITGGGLSENLPRVLPEGTAARIVLGRWPVPAEFTWLQDQGQVEQSEMLRTFNCGIGMVVVVAHDDVESVSGALEQAGERVIEIGYIVAGETGVHYDGDLFPA